MAQLEIDSIVEDVAKVVQDALYVSVGLGVIAFQKAQVRRNELQKQMRSALNRSGS